MVNKALAHAILDSGKKKQTVARLAHLEPWELSRILKGTRSTSEIERDRLAKALGKTESELFPESQSEAVAS